MCWWSTKFVNIILSFPGVRDLITSNVDLICNLVISSITKYKPVVCHGLIGE